MNKRIQGIALLVFFLSLSVKAQNPVWNQVAPGVWKAIVGIPDKFDLLKAAGSQPNTEALMRLGQASFPLPAADIVAETSDGKTFLRFPLDKSEQLYGFGLNFKTVQQRGKILQLCSMLNRALNLRISSVSPEK